MKLFALLAATLLVGHYPIHAATAAAPAPGIPVPLMVAIPPGSFQMGDQLGHGQPNELPVHIVHVRAFKMGKYEVTFAQYDAFADATGRARPVPVPEFDVGRGDHPVNMVSWQDACDYAAWLSARTGQRFRLPTEAEWEYAARAGSTGDYFWGQDLASNYANVGGATDASTGTGGKDVWLSYAPVGQLAANPFGLHDVFGNVWEWTADCANSDYVGAPNDGSAWMSGDCGKHMIRGDSFHNGPLPTTVSGRGGVAGRNPTLGFRLAQD
jgi:formylglycine-generating enzyme required for sulfatase activity